MEFKRAKFIVPKGANLYLVSPLGEKFSTRNDTGKDIELIFREPIDRLSSPEWLMMCKICGELEMGFVDIDGNKVKICKNCVAEHLYMLKWK